jgi:hypothetical protein
MYVDYLSPRNDSLTWSDAGVATAVANGQDATQIAFHEYDHVLDSLAASDGSRNHRVPQRGDLSFPANGMASVTVGGQTFNYNLSVDAQWRAYEHAVIHNDLVSTFGSDLTGALQSAVQGAQDGLAGGPSASSPAAVFARANARNAAALSVPPNQYRYAGTCTKSTSSVGRALAAVAYPHTNIACPSAKAQSVVNVLIQCCVDCNTSTPTPVPTPIATAAPTSPTVMPAVYDYVYSWYTP